MKMARKPRPAYIGDGICTVTTWANAPLSERALFVARSQERLKIREVTRNWSPAIRLYLAVAGIFNPAAWCAAFVTWCLIEAGADRKQLPKFAASTYYWYAAAKENKTLKTTPKRGRLFVWNNQSGGHIGFCLGGGEPFPTIEGNTNKRGSREGDGVFDQVREVAFLRRQARWGFIDIPDSLEVAA